MVLIHLVEEDSSGKNVKYILKSKLELSERLVKRLKYSSKIFLNSSPVYVNAIVNEGDIVEAHIDFVEDCSDIVPENIHIDIIYEDEYMIVLNKQPNIVVHPTSTHISGTIANAIMYYLNSKGISKKIRPVSRLDRDTSGIIIFAKNEYIQESLIRQMGTKAFSKEYIGVVHGNVYHSGGTINLPIERKPDSIMLRQVSPTGEHAVTHYEVLERFSNASCLKFLLETGRTHQIRVHCQAIGHPLIGDTLYVYEEFDKDKQKFIDESLGKHTESIEVLQHTKKTDTETLTYSYKLERQALHSYRVKFIHPYYKKDMELTAPIPDDICGLLEILRK